MAKGVKTATEAPDWLPNKKEANEKNEGKGERRKQTNPGLEGKQVPIFTCQRLSLETKLKTNSQILMNHEEIHSNLRKGCPQFYKL